MAEARRDGPVRPKKFIERPIPWTILLILLVAGVLALSFFVFTQIRNGGGASGRGAFYLISILGVVALLLILSTFFYTFRKRRRGMQEHMPGTMMAWFKSHIYIGVLAFLVALIHVATRPLSSNISTGKIALVVFAILVLSGMAWRAVYITVPKRVARTVGNLAVIDSEKRLAEIQVEIDKLAAGKSPPFQQMVQARLQGQSAAQVQQQAGMLTMEERADWVNVSTLADERDQLRAREVRQRRFERFLQRWKVLHIPLAIILLGVVAVHIADVFGAGRVAFGGEAKQFPNSRSCASCHSQIADDWRQSVMSHGVTSPFMIAQVALAVQKNKQEGHPLGTICTACHGPVGTILTKKDTLPFKAGEGTTFGVSSAHNLILNEGVSCVICHALDKAPGVLAGAQPFSPNESGVGSLGVIHGPKLPGGPPIPVPDHQIVQGGYMGVRDSNNSDEITTSQLCGACHVVEADINGDGKINRRLTQEHQPDLVLQTTFLEWQDDYLQVQSKLGNQTFGCMGCHARAKKGPIVDSAPFGQSPPERVVHNHSFVGVDYDLTPGHPGLSNAEFKEVLDERQTLLSSAALLQVKKLKVQGDRIAANVQITNVGNGHALPTGFAFVRQMWLEVSAKDTTTGQPICLAPLKLSPGGPVLKPLCASGHIGSPQDDLPYCSPRQLEQFDPNATLGNDDIVFTKTFPPGQCDPYMASWQKILTDRPNKESSRENPGREVPFQTKEADIVALRTRISDQQAMVPMDVPGAKKTEPKGNTNRFPVGDTEFMPYTFKLPPGAKGHKIEVTATLHFRHTEPYFIRGLSGFYPPGITAKGLIDGLTVVDMVSASRQVKA